MRAIMVMYDSLNRHMLPNYGCDWTLAPNFRRLGERAVTFDNHYVGSMPCMPARRELHTGRHNFLHRSWGPFEPFDDSTFTILKERGTYTHLVSDHYHYWEDGRRHLPSSLFELAERARPGGRCLEGRGGGAGDSRTPRAHRPAGLGEPQVHAGRAPDAAGADLRRWP